MGSIFFMFILDSNLDTNEKVSWIIGFCQALAQDFLLTPIIFVFFQMNQIDENITEVIKKKN